MTGRKEESALSLGVDLIGEDVFADGFANGLVKTDQQLSQQFAVTASQHGTAAATYASHRDASDRLHDSKGDLALVDEISDIGQAGWINGDEVKVGPLAYAGLFISNRRGATFHGSNSSMRGIGDRRCASAHHADKLQGRGRSEAMHNVRPIPPSMRYPSRYFQTGDEEGGSVDAPGRGIALVCIAGEHLARSG